MNGSSGVSVSGGAYGIAAQCDELRALAGVFADAAAETLGDAWYLRVTAALPDLLVAAPLDPVGWASFEYHLARALDAPGGGLTPTGLRCGLLEAGLRTAADSYEAVDRMRTTLGDRLAGLGRLPLVQVGAASSLAHGDGLGRAAQAGLAQDPQLADDLVEVPAVLPAVAAMSHVLPDGHGRAVSLGDDADGAAGVAPRSLADVVRGLDRRNSDPRPGSVDVRFVQLPDGSRRVIVDITGTKSWSPGRTSDVTSLTTNGRSLLGRAGAYEQGVLAAMRHAGVTKDDEVMLVGHSEGGMVAVTTARDATASGEFRVTHVVTAGSPVARTVGGLPRSVQVLALENRRDVVPHLDGLADPDLPNVTCATATAGDATVLGDHGVGSAYVPVARDAARSRDPSVRAFLAGSRDFLRGTSVRTRTYQVVRSYH